MDPDTCAEELMDSLVLGASGAKEHAGYLLEWLNCGGFMPRDEVMDELTVVLRCDYTRESLCAKLRVIAGG